MKVVKVAADESLRRKGFVQSAQSKGLVPSMSSIKPVQIPPPKISETDVPADEMAKHLSSLYQRAVAWSGADYDRKKAYWAAYATLSKDKFSAAREMKSALRQLKDESSSGMPMSVYTWWMVNRCWEEKKLIPKAATVFNVSQILSSRWRRYFWTDCGETARLAPKLWPKACEDIVDMVTDISTYDHVLDSVDEAVFAWELLYGWRYKIAMRDASRQREQIQEKVTAKYEAYDVSLYLTDPAEHLKVSGLCSSRLK